MAARETHKAAAVHKERSKPGNLPRVDGRVAAAIEAHLLDSYGMKKPPAVAARLLAFIIELFKRDLPFPTRQEVADHLGCSLYSVDSVLNTALSPDRALLTVEQRVIDGNVQQRSSAIRQRFYLPSDELLGVVQQVQRR